MSEGIFEIVNVAEATVERGGQAGQEVTLTTTADAEVIHCEQEN